MKVEAETLSVPLKNRLIHSENLLPVRGDYIEMGTEVYKELGIFRGLSENDLYKQGRLQSLTRRDFLLVNESTLHLTPQEMQVVLKIGNKYALKHYIEEARQTDIIIA